jgi:SAM-dependent methyltransferase
MPDTNTAAAAGFQNAEAYEQVMGRWSRRLAPLLIRFGGLSDGDRVLDVGCGTGSLTFTVPEIANIADVTGIDLTEPYVEFARARNTDPRISFQPADARSLPFEEPCPPLAFEAMANVNQDGFGARFGAQRAAATMSSSGHVGFS